MEEQEEMEFEDEVEEDFEIPASAEHAPLKHKEDPTTLLEYLLSHPSVDINLKKEFLAFWEMVPLGYYTEMDFAKLYNQFEMYINHMLMDVPDDEWNTMLDFHNGRMSMNQLISILKQTFYIQLTRGRKGFLTKELSTIRTGKIEPEKVVKRRRIFAWPFGSKEEEE